MSWNTFQEVIAAKEAGTFDPKSVNWAVGENAVPVNDPSNPEGFRYEKRVCIYMMGDGSQQCYGSFPLKGKPSPEVWEMAEDIIRKSMGVTRILRGVG